MKAAIVSIGNELTSGSVLNTNATFIANELHAIGIEIAEIITVGDDTASIIAALRNVKPMVSFVIVTGGLGPTVDDLTTHAAAEALRRKLTLNKQALQAMEEHFKRVGRTMIYVTHDQTEALTFADQVVVMFDGQVVQSGTPVELFERPAHTFVEEGLLKAIYTPSRYEIVNLGGANTIELRRLIDLIEGALGKKAAIEYLPPVPGDVPITYADAAKAKALLGFKAAVRIDEGVERYVKWFLERARRK